MKRFVKGLSDIGNVREENQDSFSWVSLDPNTYFLIVADGMGGYKGGAEASNLVVSNIITKIKQYDLSTLKNTPQLCINNAVKYANSKVNEAAQKNPELKNMGSTCVCTLIIGDSLYSGHIGDSRAYLLRNGTINQITEDHTVVQELVRGGYVSAENAPYHPSAGILTQCLGQMEAANPEFYPPLQLMKGDRILLCSDGLSGMLDDDEIAEIIFNEPFEQVPSVLIDMANEAGGFDNITLILYGHGELTEQYDIVKVGFPVYMNFVEPQSEVSDSQTQSQSISTGFTLQTSLINGEIPIWLIASLVGFVVFLVFFSLWIFEVF